MRKVPKHRIRGWITQMIRTAKKEGDDRKVQALVAYSRTIRGPKTLEELRNDGEIDLFFFNDYL